MSIQFRTRFAVRVFVSLMGLLPLVQGAALAEEAGVISGTIIDGETGVGVLGATIRLLGSEEVTSTDVNGAFRIPSEPGSAVLRVSAPGHRTTRLDQIEVKSGRTAIVNAAVQPVTQGEIEMLEVTATAASSNAAAGLLTRMAADSVQDIIGQADIRMSPDSNAAEIVQRMPAITIREDFIYVRGMGERYSTALLNGSRLPSTDPNKRVVPLDLFPSDFIESISIVKSYSPELPGDFAGGLVDIAIESRPPEFQASLGVATGVNTNSTFQDFETYPGCGPGDALGMGGCRNLPGAFGNQTIGNPPPEQGAALSGTLPNQWTPYSETAPMDFGFEGSMGNSWGPFGMNVSASWANRYRSQSEINREYINAGTPEEPDIVIGDDFVYDRYAYETELGALLTMGYDIDDENLIESRTLYNRSSDDEVLLGRGITIQDPDLQDNVTRLQFQNETLLFTQLGGEHMVWKDIEIDWRTAVAQSTQDTPDTRQTSYIRDLSTPDEQPKFGQYATRIFYDLTEHMSDTRVDVAIPFETGLPGTDVWEGLPARLKMGPAYTWRNRDSNLRKFSYRLQGAQDRTLPPDALLSSERILERQVGFFEATQARDSFEATETIVGGYVMLDLPLIEDELRFSGGVRIESSDINVTAYSITGEKITPQLLNTDPLPGLNLIYSPREDMNVRFGYAQTVSRPEFRELSPVEFPEPQGLRPTIGNPYLVQASIDSIDLRWDWFLESTEVISTSAFYKMLDKPIEQVVVAQGANVANSFANAKDGQLYGLEFEVRKNLDFVWEKLSELDLILNVAWIQSEVHSAKGEFQVQTSDNRALQGQAPFVINMALEWWSEDAGTFRLLYNTQGKTIDALGAYGLPDIYLQQRNQLDFVWRLPLDLFFEDMPMDLSFGAENLLNDAFVWTQGGLLQSRFQTGLTFKLGADYNF